mgnify:FL=1
MQGYGDDEFAFENIGVYSSKVNAEMAQRNAIAEALEDNDLEIVTNIEVFDMDA